MRTIVESLYDNQVLLQIWSAGRNAIRENVPKIQLCVLYDWMADQDRKGSGS